ncbi:MAG TPA: acetate--CoA ligase [Euzebyales bacterium]|nr:acetate--CoA ligase [Euzebyales bacterium]
MTSRDLRSPGTTAEVGVSAPAAAPWPVIAKAPGTRPVRPNLDDYDRIRVTFSWEDAARELDGLPGGGLNIAHETVDRHAAGPRRDVVALRFVGTDLDVVDLTYTQLADATDRFANMLDDLGVRSGERVFALVGRIPALYIAALGTLKHGSVFCPLFSAFGPEPIRQRLAIGDGVALVTTPRLYERKVTGIREAVPTLRHVLVADVGDAAPPEGTVDLDRPLANASPAHRRRATAPDDLALLHFTSGTTGTPKGAMHVHGAVVAHHATARYALDLHSDDVYWCTADPGWVTGTSYGIVAPLAHGVTSIVDTGEFDAARWYRIVERLGVTVWYTAPTAIRRLMRAGADLAAEFDLSRLRFVASVGEPLNPEAVVWGASVLGRPIHDNWWQTETGAIMIANFAASPIRPGSMGRPVPGIDAAVVRVDRDMRPVITDGVPELIDASDVEGMLALRVGWPSMFRGYLHEPGRYARTFAGDWYLSGDLARRDADGWFWFVGRADDVIKSAGHLIGPFEVESVLLEHPAVAEVGVIGTPDPLAGEIVKAFVALNPGHEPGRQLQLELLGHARRRLGAAVAPRVIEFSTDLPKTRSGKIMRRLLKARELGLPEGDTSTLERL